MPKKIHHSHFLKDAIAGFVQIRNSPVLRPLFLNTTLFAAMILWLSPLETALMLKEMHLYTWQYGVALALPCTGGLIGAWLTSRLVGRFGNINILKYSSLLRGIPVLAIAFAPANTLGFIILILSNFVLLFAAGVFGPVYSVIRMHNVDDEYMTRVVTAFVLSSRTLAPALVLIGGVIGTCFGVRTGIFIGAVLLIIASCILPWKYKENSKDISI